MRDEAHCRLRNSWMQTLHSPAPMTASTQARLRPASDSRQRKEAERTTPAHWIRGIIIIITIIITLIIIT